ncbi:MAG: hypothetical protein H7X93_14605 [Sphingomonadaceae bacterium]|nr:hypothetical protein [Sphingomonadaceae bacterium]
MTPILKDPGAELRYVIVWTPGVLDGASIEVAQWVVEPQEVGGVTTAADFISGSDTGAEFSGGIAGRVYRAACRVTLSDGRIDERSLLLRVEER